jgi:carboxyl-terminal processing protease
LDLSRNGGGLLEDAVRISGFFLKKGPVVATQDTHRRKDILSDTDSEVLYSGPLVVLTSRLSASASEILAGALKDYKRALIVGADHTFGKGTVQVLQPLPLELGAMKVTTGMYFLPKGLSTQHRGVAADIVLPSLFSTDDIGEKTLDYSLPQVSIDAFFGNEVNSTDPSSRYAEVDSTLVSRLAQASAKRVAAEPKFQELRKEMAEMEKNRGPVKLSELRKKSEAEKKKEDKDEANGKGKGSKRKRRGDTDTPQLQEALRILGDWLAPTA